MQETLCRLFNLAAVLVYFSYMCIPMPLRNTTIFHTSHTTRTPDVNRTENLTSIHFHSSDLSRQPRCSTYFTTEMVRLTTQTHVSSVALTTVATTPHSIVHKTTITYGELLSKLHSATSWIKDFGQKSTFIPVQSPSRQSKNLPSLARVYQAAKTRRENVEQQMQIEHLWPSALGVLLAAIILLFVILVWRKAHSLDFVRSAAINYDRQVDPDTKTNLTNMKAFLPIMAAAKGIYGRGRMNELNDVYSRMGDHAPHGAIELCFPEGFTYQKELPPCTRIRLLTPEDIAREDL